MDECVKDFCPKCALRFWCDHRLDQQENLSNLVQRMIAISNPNFIVR